MADVAGHIHRLDHDLTLRQSSIDSPGRQPFYALVTDGTSVVGKDRLGNIARWDADSLDMLDYLHSAALRDSSLPEEEEPSLTLARGIAIWGDKVYTSTGYLQLAVLDLVGLRVRELRESPTGDAPIEWICTEADGLHALSDKLGRLFLGDLDTLEFPTVVQIDAESNLHRVRYDRAFDRFWVTQDSGIGDSRKVANGVVTITRSGELDQNNLFASDDVECMELSRDGTSVYVGGFDGVVHQFDNRTPELKIARTYGPFSHQISDLVVGEDGAVTVLTQDGELRTFTESGEIRDRHPFRRQAVWDMQPTVEDERVLLLATDHGVTRAKFTASDVSGPALVVQESEELDRGFVRRVVPVPGGWVAATRQQFILRSGPDGIAWEKRFDGLIHTISVAPDFRTVLAATNNGGFELDLETGDVLRSLSISDNPLWASCYLPNGDAVLGTHSGKVCVFDAGSRITAEVELIDYPKRMWLHDGELMVSGAGGVQQLDLATNSVRAIWGEALSNTCENAAVVDDARMYIVTYDQQLGAYDYASGELIGILEDLPDIPKAITVLTDENGSHLVVGGRSGFLRTYRLAKDGTVLAGRDIYLPRHADPGSTRIPVSTVRDH
ncbi:PQQ-binding-like beta-propeller repeat protein [Umezawaea tangerina]|uniref:PQQ-binding-like beta-propeller repeat protein n=1 Tax=Umezawaea tangerina TaxID=84725 RepID=UPI000D080691|nr:PQQ-binding-like beta-propeller repeat protein [Umezawaea tangerina]